MKIDLHIHTQASDGTWDPLQLIAKVQQSGIGLFAVTDHDTLQNSLACAALLPSSGLQFVQAVEISASWTDTYLHILAYGANAKDSDLIELLDRNRQTTAAAHRDSLNVLQQTGLPIDLTDFLIYRHDPARGGWKMLNFLVDRGFCTGLEDLVGGLFNAQRPMIEPVYPAPQQVISTIRRAGGMPVLAHPGGYRIPLAEDHIRTLVNAGLCGLECYSIYHDPAATKRFLDLCNAHNLLITGGSDCHGDFVPERQLGNPVIALADLNIEPILARAQGSR